MNELAILIVTFNSSSVIKVALECLNRQTIKPNKILIVDNASDDLDKLLALASCYPDCEVIACDKNHGFARANNIGIQILNAYELIALLNPDAYPDSDWLENLIAAAQKYPQTAFFASKQLQEKRELIDGTGDCISFTGQPFRRDYSKKASKISRFDEDIFSACAAAALYRRSALDDVGGFDEDYFCYVEDIDLGFRLQLKGYKCKLVPNAVVVHLGSSTTGKRSDFSMYYGQRNVVFSFVKNMPTPLILFLIVPFFLSTLIHIFHGIFIGKGLLVLRSKLDAFKDFESLLKKRAIVQRTRKVSSLYILNLLSLKKI